MNVIADGSKRRPRAIDKQIDIPSMLREKQVIYFYLSSAQEQATRSRRLRSSRCSHSSPRQHAARRTRTNAFMCSSMSSSESSPRTSASSLSRPGAFKLHFILANQTIGQLEKQGVNLTDVVESCTAFKQSFRATDEKSIKRIMETSGEAVYHSLQWTQLLDTAFVDSDDEALSVPNAVHQSNLDPRAIRQGLVGVAAANVTESVGSRMEKNTIIEVSARPLARFVRFSESSGYTQFSGYQTPFSASITSRRPSSAIARRRTGRR